MRVLHVIPSFWPAMGFGGPIHSAVGLTKEMVRQGHKVTVLTTDADVDGRLDVPLERPVDMDGVQVRYFARRPPRWWYYAPALGRALADAAAGYDIVSVTSIYLYPTMAASLAAQKAGVPYVIRPAGSLDPVTLNKPYAARREQIATRVRKGIYFRTLANIDLQRATAIHYTAEAEREAAAPLGLRPHSFVQPLGVDLSDDLTVDRNFLEERYPLLRGRKVVLFLGRLDRVKGINVTLEALGQMASTGSNFVFVVAGGGHPTYESELRRLAASVGLSDCTVFTGSVSGTLKAALLRRADVFVLTSYHENFGVAVVEAMAAGVPVVISNQVQVHREVSLAGAGLVTDVDASGVAAAVSLLLADDGLRQRMGWRGRALVRERYRWDQVTRDLVACYERLTREHGVQCSPRPI